MTDVNSPDMRCFQMRPGTATATVVAGDKLGFVANAEVSHFGPLQFYMAKVPEGANINTWDPAGNVWAKVAKIDAIPNPKGLTSSETTWPTYRMAAYAPLPRCLGRVTYGLTILRIRRKECGIHRTQRYPQR